MMGILATVWAIGVAVYQFIYQYFAEHYLKEAKQMADEREQGKHIEETKRKDMRRRLLQNAFVYVTYVFAGIFSAFMIGVGTLALAEGNTSYFGLARWLFAAALSIQFGLFTFEIFTSAWQVAGFFVSIGPRDGNP